MKKTGLFVPPNETLNMSLVFANMEIVVDYDDCTRGS